MAKLHQLTAVAISAAPARARLHDGGGLIYDAASKCWTLRYTSPVTRKRRDMGLGPASLKRARELADECRDALRAGVDPLQAREAAAREARDALARAAAGGTLRSVAETYHASVAGGFRNAKHRAQWLASLELHIFPTLGDKPIGAITAAELLDLLLPLQGSVPETAKRVRMRLAAIFDDAVLRGVAPGNPAAAIKRRLADARGKRAPAHFRSLPYAMVPGFVARLRADARFSIPSRLALEFLILGASRTGEVLGARPEEIDGEIWTIPPERMKAGQEHRVPLGKRALEIIDEAKAFGRAYLFPSLARRGRPLSGMAMLEVMRGMLVDPKKPGGDTFAYLGVVHGFRSAFSSWARERTKFRVEVIEAALAHREKDRVAAAYSSQATYWADRVALSRAWAAFVTSA